MTLSFEFKNMKSLPLGFRSLKVKDTVNNKGYYSMIIGAHSIIYSKHPDADRAFLRDVLKLTISMWVTDG